MQKSSFQRSVYLPASFPFFYDPSPRTVNKSFFDALKLWFSCGPFLQRDCRAQKKKGSCFVWKRSKFESTWRTYGSLLRIPVQLQEFGFRYFYSVHTLQYFSGCFSTRLVIALFFNLIFVKWGKDWKNLLTYVFKNDALVLWENYATL